MKKDRKQLICYMCDSIATSREHVPPLCLFPEEKDIKTNQFRTNLITVPSCDIHNSNKSKDDEFLMASLAGIVGNNHIGYLHNQTKVKRAIERKDVDFLNSIVKNRKENLYKNENGTNFSIIEGRPDMNRLQNCFIHIAYGLFYAKFKRKFKGEINTVIDFVFYENETMEKIKHLIRTSIKFEKKTPLVEGQNKEIFNYSFSDADENGLIGLHLTFYEGAKVFIAFKEDGLNDPKNIAMDLIYSGMRTTIVFDENNKLEFNK